MKIDEIIYALFLVAGLTATVLLLVVVNIQYYKYEETKHEHTERNSTVRPTWHNDRYEYPGYSRVMGCEPDDDGFSNYILPNIQWLGYPRLRSAGAYPAVQWAPSYYRPWRKPARPIREPGIGAARSLYA